MRKLSPLLIVCSEFCERFCFYGLRSLLFVFTRYEYNFSARGATLVLHLFISLSYLFTLFGGILSDMFLGKYNTIVFLSIVYFVGTILLTYGSAVSNSVVLIVISLLMISFGVGGIKPCVAAFGGDQFHPEDTVGLGRFFNLFYFSINVGSMLSMTLMPAMSTLSCFGRHSCYPFAFGTASVLLGGSIILFVLGTNLYIIKPANNDGYFAVFRSLVQQIREKTNKSTSLEKDVDVNVLQYAATSIHKSNTENDTEKFLKIVRLLGPIAFFWMLYDQKSSSWIEQGAKMNGNLTFLNKSIEMLPSQMQAFNAVFVILFIPLFSKIIYPAAGFVGIASSSVEKMGSGIILASISFFCSAFLEHKITHGAALEKKLSLLWQLPQYIFLTAGEVMLNVTGLEYAYSEAPEAMKSLVLSMWLLAVAVGNFLVMIFSSLDVVLPLSLNSHDMWRFIAYGSAGLLAARYVFYIDRESKVQSKGRPY